MLLFIFLFVQRSAEQEVEELCQEMNFNLTNLKTALKLYDICHDSISGHKRGRIIGRGQANDVLRGKIVESWTR